MKRFLAQTRDRLMGWLASRQSQSAAIATYTGKLFDPFAPDGLLQGEEDVPRFVLVPVIDAEGLRLPDQQVDAIVDEKLRDRPGGGIPALHLHRIKFQPGAAAGQRGDG